MHENRSFDHYFGMLDGVHGFADPNNSGAFSQTWPGGPESTLLPFHLDTTLGNAECTSDLSHSWQAEHASWNSGAMDSFVSTHVGIEGASFGTLTMGYYTSADIPYYYALADAFTICDNYFCSVLGPTHPNRLMQMTGTIDPTGAAGGPILTTSSDNTLTGSCTWTTMPEILQDASISWKVYNPYGASYQPANPPLNNQSSYITGDGISMAECKNPLFYMNQFQAYDSDPDSLYQRAFGNCGVPIPVNKNVYAGGTGSLTAPGGGPNDFLTDVKGLNGASLPQVSWIIPPTGYDEHPPAPAALGEWYTSQVVKTLMSNKEVWESTVLFIMYDENDGWFDHVPPPTAPGSTSGEYVTGVHAPGYALGQPIGLGVRVPMLVVSPFSQGGWVCSDPFDHTSQLQFIGKVFGVDGTVDGNVSSWRQGAVGDLTATLPNYPLPTTAHGVTIYPKKPTTLPKTSDKMSAAPVDFPSQCNANNDMDELGGTSLNVYNCTTTLGKNTITSTSNFKTAGVYLGQTVTGAGIPPSTTVTTVGATKIKISSLATASSVGPVMLTFPQPYLPFTIDTPQSQPIPVAPPVMLRTTPH